MIRIGRLSYLLLCVVFLVSLSHLADASIHKHLWRQWEVNNPLSHDMISHQEWQTFLKRRTVENQEGILLVDYAALTPDDHQLLHRYLQRMSKINILNYNRKEQLAYWLNMYNALTVQLVARFYPIASIQDINISPGLFSVGPWGAKVITVNSTPLSLDDIQNRIIRPIWNDPRIHYALNNAAIGSANLKKNVYQGHCLEKQLNAAALDYINSFRGTQVVEGKLIVSKIYEWYGEDFGENEQDIIHHLSIYAREPLKNNIQTCQSISGYIYNWHLNGTVSHS